MRELYKKYKREILVGVVVSLVTTAILRFGDLMLKVVPAVGGSIYETFINIVYSLAANYTDSMVFKMFILGLLGYVAGVTLSIVKEGIKTYKTAIRLEKKSVNIPFEKLEKITEEAVLEVETENKRITKDNFQKIIDNGKKHGKTAIILGILVVTLYCIFIFWVVKPMNLYNEFDRDILKIKPYADENLVTKLKSDWVCMRSKLDYEEIYVIIEKIEEEYMLPN